MKYSLTLIFLLVLLQSGTALNFFDFMKGFAVGLHFEKLAPKILDCKRDVSTNVEVIKNLIGELKKKHTFYEKGNIVTKALWYIPDACRSCSGIPIEFWENFKEKFLKEFHYNLVEYLHAVFLNLGQSMDEIIYNIKKLAENFAKKDYYNAGYSLGNLTNVLLNVTNKNLGIASYEGLEIEINFGIDWDVLHQNFVKYVGYTVAVLNYTKLMNGTSIKNLNESVMNAELKVYKGIKKLGAGEILEGILLMIDTLKNTNQMFNGFYFTIQQIMLSISKNTIFDRPDLALTNLLLHSGYFIWDGYRLYLGIKSKNHKEILKRIVDVLKKIVYFDEDMFEEILIMLSRME